MNFMEVNLNISITGLLIIRHNFNNSNQIIWLVFAFK